MKHNKKVLLTSIVMILLCMVMLIGSTFAWFTDSVVSSGNVIKAGTLDIDVSYYDVTDTGSVSIDASKLNINGVTSFTFDTSAKATSIENNEHIFSEELWEPGKSSAKLIKIKNNGTLASKVKMYINPTENVVDYVNLEDVMWFDFVPMNEQMNLERDLERKSIDDFRNNTNNDYVGPVLASGERYFLLVYGMNETAGNEYQGKTFDASIHFLATQAVYEKDGFGNDKYDEQSTVEVSTPEEYFAALERAGRVYDENTQNYVTEGASNVTIILKNDIDFSGYECPFDNKLVVFENLVVDGQGHMIKNYTADNYYCYEGGYTSFRNITFENCSSQYGIFGYGPDDTSSSTDDRLVIENITLKSTNTYGGSLLSHTGSANVTIKNCHVDESTVVDAFSSGLASGGFIGNSQKYRIEDSSFKGTIIDNVGNAGMFVGQGAYNTRETIIIDSVAGGTIRSFKEGSNVYLIAGSTIGDRGDGKDNVLNVDYSSAKVEKVDTLDKVYTAINEKDEDFENSFQYTSPISEDDVIINENSGITLTTIDENVSYYTIVQSIVYSHYKGDGEVVSSVSTGIKDTVVVNRIDISTDSKIDEYYKVVQVVDEEGLPNRDENFTTDTSYVGEIHEGTYYFDARNQSDGSYNALVLKDSKAQIIVKVIAYDENGSLLGSATKYYNPGTN